MNAIERFPRLTVTDALLEKVNQMMTEVHRIPLSRFLVSIFLTLVLVPSAWSQNAGTDEEEEEPKKLFLPADIAARSDRSSESEKANYIVEEWRVGGRLERIIVNRSNTLTSVYEVRDVDSAWLNEEKELGETPNVQRWTIGSW